MHKFEQIHFVVCYHYMIAFLFQQYEARERELENRILQKFESQIEGLQHEIKHLEQEVRSNEKLQQENRIFFVQTRDRDRRIAELEDDIKSQVTHHDPDMESRHSRVGFNDYYLFNNRIFLCVGKTRL